MAEKEEVEEFIKSLIPRKERIGQFTEFMFLLPILEEFEKKKLSEVLGK
jgi:hypothetical protein